MASSHTKILSIIVPSYNMEAYLPKCLESLVLDDENLLAKLEVIVVNDGSKDRTSEIGHAFAEKNPGVFRVIDKDNGHYGSCINAGLTIASGKYVRVLDADDSVDTEGFSHLMSVVEKETCKEEPVDLIVTDYAQVDPDGNILRHSKYWNSEDVTTLSDYGGPASRLTIHSICYKTENLIEIGYHQREGVPYTDTEWIVEPMIKVGSVRYIQKIVTLYLIGRSGQTMDPAVLAKNFQVIIDITKGLVERFEKNRQICEPSALQYYRKQIVLMISCAYNWGLLSFEGYKVKGDVGEFDAWLKDYAEFYREAESFIFGPNHLPFRYVKAWRKHGYNWYWKLRHGLSVALLWSAKMYFRIYHKANNNVR